MEKYGVRQGKVVRLSPAPSKVEADIKSMPPGDPIREETARRILASQIETSWAPQGLSRTAALVLSLVAASLLVLAVLLK